MCVEGYTSSLAAASLQDLGLAGATDLAGGFRAWQRAGLPVVSVSPGERPPGTPRWPGGSRDSVTRAAARPTEGQEPRLA
jgi:3-mercaptopyruvate sulfurtransferase SseA